MQYNDIIPIILIISVIFLRSSISVFYRKKINNNWSQWMFSQRLKYPLYAYIIAITMIVISMVSNLLAWVIFFAACFIVFLFFAFQEIEDVDKNYQRKIMLYFPSNILFKFIKRIYRKIKHLIMIKL